MKPRNCLIKLLCSANCLTKSQVSLISRLRFSKEKNHELLKAARKLSAKQHFAFVECLSSDGQYEVADVIEKGGVAVKVEMSNAKASSQEAMEKNLIARLRQLLVEKQRAFANFMGSSNLRNTKLATIQKDKSSENDKGIVFWFLCKTHDDLHQVEQNYNELIKEITELIDHLFPQPHVTTATYSRYPVNDLGFAPTAVIADTRQFRKETHIRDVVINRHTFGMLNLNGTWPLAVASLEDEIYVLLFNSIHIYQDQHPFLRQKKVPIPPINKCCSKVNKVGGSLSRISICQKSLCAYISCTTPGCVRKLTAKYHVHSFWLSGIEHMRFLCTMNTGYVLILKARQEVGYIVNSFDIYNSEAVLVNQCQLQPSADFPLHLFEMSPLKFAIKYSRNWCVNILDKGYQFISSRKIDSEDIYESITMYAAGKVITSNIVNPNTPYRVNAVIMLDSSLMVGKFLLPLNNATDVRVFYCKEKRQLIILRYVARQLIRKTDNVILETRVPEVQVIQIKYDDEID